MTEERHILSVIIPHYNTPSSLSRLLDSIGHQAGIQVIVVDDHSDRYLSELKNCQKNYSYVVFVQNDVHKKGAGSARNTGLRHADGRWLLFADADDEFLPGWLTTVSDYLTSDYDLVYFKPTGKRQNGFETNRHVRYAKLVENYLSKRYGGDERLRFRFSVPWSKLIRSDVVFKNNIYFEEVPFSEDIMFSTKTGYYARKITADRRMIYCVVENEGSTTSRITGDLYCFRMKMICERERFLNEHLEKKTRDAAGRICVLFTIKDAVIKRYRVRTVLKLCRVFAEYGIPFIVINFRKYLPAGKD